MVNGSFLFQSTYLPLDLLIVIFYITDCKYKTFKGVQTLGENLKLKYSQNNYQKLFT